MPRESDPRIQVRFSRDEMEILRSLADGANMALGSLIREAAMRSAAEAVRDARRGEVTFRRQRPEKTVRAERAVQAVRGQVESASELLARREAGMPESVRVMRERQVRLNERIDGARKP